MNIADVCCRCHERGSADSSTKWQGGQQPLDSLGQPPEPRSLGKTCTWGDMDSTDHCCLCHETHALQKASPSGREANNPKKSSPSFEGRMNSTDLRCLCCEMHALQTCHEMHALQKAAPSGREADNTKESLLYFEGPIQVQGLFEYLYNEPRRVCGEDADVPLLLAPAAFPAACLKHQIIKVRS